MDEKNIRSLFVEDPSGNFYEIMNSDSFPDIRVGYTQSLIEYEICITNNELKMHKQPKERRIAGRKRVRRYGKRQSFRMGKTVKAKLIWRYY